MVDNPCPLFQWWWNLGTASQLVQCGWVVENQVNVKSIPALQIRLKARPCCPTNGMDNRNRGLGVGGFSLGLRTEAIAVLMVPDGNPRFWNVLCMNESSMARSCADKQ